MMNKETKMTMLTMSQALALLAKADFKPFTRNDWYAFSGCDSADPMIYYDEVAGLTIIHDGEAIDFIDDDGESRGQLNLTTN